MNKICFKCKGPNETVQSYCASCHNEYQKQYYKDNPKSIKESCRSRRKNRRDYIVNKKTNIPCADCKIIYPWYVMDFDHVYGKKKFLLSDASNKIYSLETIDAEILKCDLVCANCHRIRTFTRLQLSDGVIGNITGFEPVR